MKQMACLFIFAFSVATFGKFSVGTDMNYSYGHDIQKNVAPGTTQQTVSSNSLSLNPYIGIYAGEIMEIDPFIGFGLNQSSTTVEDSSGTSTTSSHSQNTFQLGCRLLFHVLRLQMFDVSLGPELGYRAEFSPDASNFWIGGPFAIDVHFTDRFAVRLSTQLAMLNYFSNSSPSNHTNFTFNLQSVFQPMFGFYFTF
jgi:hypothetical protein